MLLKVALGIFAVAFLVALLCGLVAYAVLIGWSNHG